jgi:hypothetical protein
VVGRTLAHFRIQAQLGAGGMGEVYLARDTRLNRDVAIKVLPAALAGDQERLARLEREARLLAALNHPNIAAVHGLEEADGVRFLVMELVPGESLAQRLARGALGVEEALDVGRQVAEALATAHEKGIIHRDLKPGNVMLAPDGRAKVLDFGLAMVSASSVAAADLSRSPTLTAQATREGVILGTAAYMSPEQARGKPLDRRTDIWSFGCLLYESLAGRRAFTGETVTDVLAAILNTEPAWEALPIETPPGILELLKRCLRKDSQRRLRDAGDARLEIEDALSSAPAARFVAPIVARRHGTRWALWAVGAALIAAAFVAGTWIGSRRAVPVQKWKGDRLLGGSLLAYGPRISPDGRTLAFLALVEGMAQVAIMKPDSGDWTFLTRERSRGSAMNLSWSTDSTRIYFDRGEEGIYNVPAVGGEERLVLEGAAGPEVMLDGSLLVSRIEKDRNLRHYRYWPESARLEAVGPPLLQVGPIQSARLFPDGKEAVFVGVPAQQAGANRLPRLNILDLVSGELRPVAPGSPMPLLDDPYQPLAVSPDGRSVITDVKSGDLHRLVAIPREGNAPARVLFALTAPFWSVDVASDGTIYVDQCDRTAEVLSFAASGGAYETIARATGDLSNSMNPLQLADGRVLLSSSSAGKDRLVVARPGSDPSPFIQTDEETAGPVVEVGTKAVAFFIGTPPAAEIAIATTDGRILRRMKGAGGGRIQSLAASPDGATLYYADSASIWSIPAAGGTPAKFHAGDGVAIDPANGDLIIQLNEMGATRLMRVSPSGGNDREITVGGGFNAAPQPISGRIVGPDGRMVITVWSRDSWFWFPAVLDPAGGFVRRVPVPFEDDLFPSNWANDGSILGIGRRLKTAIWRFRPQQTGAAEIAP